MRGQACFLAVTLAAAIIGCSEAPKPAPPAAPPTPPAAETPPPAETPPVIPIEPPLLERAPTESTIKGLDSPQTAEPAAPPVPSSAASAGQRCETGLGNSNAIAIRTGAP